MTQQCKHKARQNWNSWYSMSTNLRSVSQTLRQPSRLSRLLIRTDTSLDRDSRGTPRVRDRSSQNCSTTVDSRGSTRARPSHQTRTVSTYQDSRGTPRVRPNPVVTGTETLSIQHMSKTDQNCAGLMRAKRHGDTSRCGQQSNRREQCERCGSCAQG